MSTLVFLFDRLAPRECRNARSPLTDGQAENNKVCHREAPKVCHREAPKSVTAKPLSPRSPLQESTTYQAILREGRMEGGLAEARYLPDPPGNQKIRKT